MAHWTARICWILCFGVVYCSLFALNHDPVSFAMCKGKEILLSVPGSMLGLLKYVHGCLVRHCTLQILQMGIWKVSYFLICTWGTSLWCPCSHEFPVFSLIPVGLLQVLRRYSVSVAEWLQTSERELQPLQLHSQSVTSPRVTYKVRAVVRSEFSCKLVQNLPSSALLVQQVWVAGQNSFISRMLDVPSCCSVWVVWDALISAARIYLSVREAGSTFVECLSSDLEELERLFILLL